MDEEYDPKRELMDKSAPTAPAPRSRKTSPFLVVAIFLVGLAICAGVGVDKYRRTFLPCSYQPDSIRQPPIPAGAEQVAAGTFSATNSGPVFEEKAGNQKLAHKEIHFEITAKPEEVYNFYKESLSRDGWSNEAGWPNLIRLLGGVQLTPSSAHATFHWECGLGGIWAVDWLRAEVMASGKTHVSLNYEYHDYIP